MTEKKTKKDGPQRDNDQSRKAEPTEKWL